MIEVSILAAFVAGVLTFFAPCTLPLIPAFVGYLGGSDTNDNSKYKTVGATILFCLGFSLVFIVLGSSLGFVSQSLLENRDIISRIGGGLIVFLGIYLLVRPFLPTRAAGVSGFSLKQYVGNTFVNALIIGIVFGFSFSPCLGPILGAILTLAITSGSSLSSVVLLAAFSVGLSLPFIMLGIFYSSLSKRIAEMSPKILQSIERGSAILLIVFGILLVTGSYGFISTQLLELYEAGFISRFGNYL